MVVKNFKDEVRSFLMNTSRTHLKAIDAWAEMEFPGESLDVQPDTQSRVEQGDFLSALRLLRQWLRADEFELETEANILLCLRVMHHTSSLLFGASMAYRAQKLAVRRNSSKAARARHEENHIIAAEIKCWYRENYAEFRSMDAASTRAIKHFPVSFKTAAKHIRIARNEMLEEAKKK